MLIHNNPKLSPDATSTAALQLEPTATVAHLRQIAERHKVCYEVCPEWSMSEGRKISIGFELNLCGVNDHDPTGQTHPVPGCAICARTHAEMREIAEWILPREQRPSRYEIYPFDRALHIAPGQRRRRSEVIVKIVIMHRHDFNQPVDECENRCLTEMRQRLSELGIHQGVSYAPGSSR